MDPIRILCGVLPQRALHQALSEGPESQTNLTNVIPLFCYSGRVQRPKRVLMIGDHLGVVHGKAPQLHCLTLGLDGFNRAA